MPGAPRASTTSSLNEPIVVHGTRFLATDPRCIRREKIARITLDSMVQFVGLLDAEGTVLEINKVALDTTGITLADVEGRPFSTTFWRQVSPEIDAELRVMIARAAHGELVRWNTEIPGIAGGHETIIMEMTLTPVRDDAGEVVFICVEGRDITGKKVCGRPRVLVVEDNRDMNDFISECLAGDYEVMSACDGCDALAKALAFQPALIVTDLMMPKVGGDALIVEMRQRPELRDTPVLLLCAKTDERLTIGLLDEGATDYIVKPFSEGDLRARVKNLILARQAGEAAARPVALGQDEAELLRTIERIGSSITSETDVHRIGQTVTDEATRLVGAQFGAFFYNVLDDRGESFTLYTLSGVPREAFASFPMPRNTAVFEPTFRGTSVVRSGDITRDERYGRSAPYHGMPAGHLPVRSYLAVPVVSHGKEVLGGLFFGHERPDVFTARHERLVVGVAGWAAVAMDNARLYDEQLRARAQLERALAAAQEARADAERANHVKSRFLATVSHELRTPLTAIQGYVQLLELGLHGPLTAEQRETLSRVQRSQRALQALIDDVLNFARLEAGRVEYRIEAVNVRDVVTAVLQMLEQQLAAKGLSSRVEIPHTLQVAADPDKLRQILLNLLSNAMKFTDSGGSVTVDAPRGDGMPDSIVAIRVADTGRGIPRARQNDIFDPFVQVHRLDSTPAGGLGLGLAISRDLARGMGGDLRVRGDDGCGSAFTLTLPAA